MAEFKSPCSQLTASELCTADNNCKKLVAISCDNSEWWKTLESDY